MTPTVAIATCTTRPTWEVDDQPLIPALASVGVRAFEVPWDADMDWGTVDAVWIRTTWDYTWRLEAFLAWVDTLGPRSLIPPEVVRWNADKRYLKVLGDAGIPLAPTIWLEPGDDPAPAIRAAGWRRGFLKPVVGANSNGTLRFPCNAQGLAAATAHARALDEPLMAQPYLGSVEEEGEVSVILADGVITHAVRKIPPAGDYRVQDDHGAADQPLGLFHGEDAFALQVHEALARVGPRIPGGRPPIVSRVDTLRDDRGRLVLNELELIEPSLFLRHGPGAADAMARAVAARLR